MSKKNWPHIRYCLFELFCSKNWRNKIRTLYCWNKKDTIDIKLWSYFPVIYFIHKISQRFVTSKSWAQRTNDTCQPISYLKCFQLWCFRKTSAFNFGFWLLITLLQRKRFYILFYNVVKVFDDIDVCTYVSELIVQNDLVSLNAEIS